MKMLRVLTALLACVCATAQETIEPATQQSPVADADLRAEAEVAEIPTSKPGSDKPVAYLRADRLDLDTTVVTGNRELPKVLYIVPWKKAELGEMPAQPFNTLLDEVLAPVDRDVFKREVKFFYAIDSGAPAASHKPTK